MFNVVLLYDIEDCSGLYSSCVAAEQVAEDNKYITLLKLGIYNIVSNL